MPTKLKRYTINVSPEFGSLLEKDAEATFRPVANHILSILNEYYAGREKQTDLFRDRGRGARRAEIPYFETPPPADAPPKASGQSPRREGT